MPFDGLLGPRQLLHGQYLYQMPPQRGLVGGEFILSLVGCQLPPVRRARCTVLFLVQPGLQHCPGFTTHVHTRGDGALFQLTAVQQFVAQGGAIGPERIIQHKAQQLAERGFAHAVPRAARTRRRHDQV